MQYRSTRGTVANAKNAAEAVIQGLAPDGGLYVPVDFPHPEFSLEQLSGITLQQASSLVLSWLMDDWSAEQRTASIHRAYGSQWDDPAITPLTKKVGGNYFLELFHGPTLAFKDVALQLLPQLMTRAVKLMGLDRKIVILTATSGDTGGASMDGFSNVDGTQVVVFYPHHGVSPVQLHQMRSLPGDNLTPVAVDGNFDDAQQNVKQIFNDPQLRAELAAHQLQFSSANSMNIGRLIPQIAYYFYAYGQLLARHDISAGDQVNFTVPTGNFGDILAGYYAQKLGLPVHRLVCASDQNNVLTDFFTTGKYDRRRDFTVTNSPSMDILVSSNLERLLFDTANGDDQRVAALMSQLQRQGFYQVSDSEKDFLDSHFAAGYADEQLVRDEIHRSYHQDHYAIDPHTAVASAVARQYQEDSGDETPMVIISTASPFKFPETVYYSITGKAVDEPGLPAIRQLQQLLGGSLPRGVANLFNRQDRPQRVVDPAAMSGLLETILF